jgi:murein DD-endopeptidase MepM/ murein hydrolase activator NlpD
MSRNLIIKNFKLKTILAAVFLTMLIGGGEVFATTQEDLRTQIDEKSGQIKVLEAEIAKYQSEIDGQEKTAKTLQGQINNLNSSINKLAADIKWTEKKIGKAQLEIENTLIDIAKKEKDIGGNKTYLASTLREISEVDAQSLAETLLAHDQLSDFFSNLKQLEDLESGIGANLTTLKDAKTELEKKQEELQVQKNDLEDLQGQLADRKDIQENAKDEKQGLLRSTKNKEAEYQKMLVAREKERAAIIKDIATIEDEMRKLIDPTALPRPNRGVLAWPVANPIVKQEFGMTSFAKSNSDVYNGKGHNGIDLKASVGTPIYAAEEGEVLRTGNTDLSCPGGSYGKWVLIEHPNNLATLYAHLSLIKVNDGQSVKRGELIGYGGNTGYTTGPHLHFTVYAAGKAGEIRFGPSPSGRCKLLPFGGYLNPLDYL